MQGRKAGLTHCPRGHEYTPANTLLESRGGVPSNRRRCRTCRLKQKRKDARQSKLRIKYGMTPADYEAMRRAQDDGCAICGTPRADSSRTSLNIDHDHDTGRVRGLLCGPCNKGLGSFKDNPALLYVAAEYLMQSQRAVRSA